MTSQLIANVEALAREAARAFVDAHGGASMTADWANARWDELACHRLPTELGPVFVVALRAEVRRLQEPLHYTGDVAPIDVDDWREAARRLEERYPGRWGRR